MSQIEPEFEGWGYPVIAWANGEKCVLFQQFGSYSGEWLMLTKNEQEYKVYKDWYGSCSGCDAYEAETPKTLSQAKKFAEDYRSFVEVPIETMRNLARNGTMKKVFPANINDEYSELSYDDFCSDAQISVKLEEDIDVTAADVLACKNQEIKQQALKRFGYERFVDEIKFEEIDRLGEDALLRKDDIVFAYVKDASTPRRYLLRVPPHMRRIREAVAWTFGMTEREYNPIAES
jgi:hypothetical protein